jgi:hypothetical protein
MELTDPFEVTVVETPHNAESPAPKRTSLPSMDPVDWSTPMRVIAGFPPASWATAKVTIGMYSASITANTVMASFRRLVKCPRVQTIAIGMTRIDQVSAKLESGVEFSYGCVEFGPK